MPNTKIVDELAKIPRLEGEYKTEWVFRAFHTWWDNALAMIATRSTVAWTLVLAALFEFAPGYVYYHTDGVFFITMGDDDWLRLIRAHSDEIVADADELMPHPFWITSDEIRWILNTLGKHIAES